MTVRIYHNTDDDAPVLSNTAGSLIEVLEAVLVTGYGDKQPLGWTKEFHVGNVAVFRNDPSIVGSTGMYLRVEDTNANYAQVRCYKTMTDVNTGTDVTPNGAISNQNNYIYWHKHSTSSGSPKRWVIVGDERTFYLQINTYDAYPADRGLNSQLAGCGDYDSFVPGNEWNYFIFGRQSVSSSGSSFPAQTNNCFLIGRSQDLVASKPAQAMTICPYNNQPGVSTHRELSPYTGLQHFTPPYFESEVSGTYYIAGMLRGCVFYIGRSSPEQWFTDFGKIEGPNGPNFYEMVSGTGTTNSAHGSIIVKDGVWD